MVVSSGCQTKLPCLTCERRFYIFKLCSLPTRSTGLFAILNFQLLCYFNYIMSRKRVLRKMFSSSFCGECKKKTQCVNVIKINTKIAIKNGDACSKSHLACLTVTIVRKLEWITIFSSNFLSRSYSKGAVYMPKNMLRRSGSETSRKSR